MDMFFLNLCNFTLNKLTFNPLDVYDLKKHKIMLNYINALF